MLYLLDANVLIDANRDYYPLGRVPEFWDWLVARAREGRVKIPLEILEEIRAGREDELTGWLNENRDALLLDETVDEALVARVTDQGYAPDLTEEEVERVGRDPFLIAYALGSPERKVVTTEASKPRDSSTCWISRQAGASEPASEHDLVDQDGLAEVGLAAVVGTVPAERHEPACPAYKCGIVELSQPLWRTSHTCPTPLISMRF